MRAHREAQVREMLIHLLSYYRSDVVPRPQFAEEAIVMAATIHSFQEVLAMLPDARRRWKVTLSVLVPKLSMKAVKGGVQDPGRSE